MCLGCVFHDCALTKLQEHCRDVRKVIKEKPAGIFRGSNVSLVTLLEWEVFMTREIPTN